MKDRLIYKEILVEILHHQVHRLRNKEFALGKILVEESIHIMSYLASRSSHDDQVPSPFSF